MTLQLAESKTAQEAYSLVADLQTLLVKNLESLPSRTPKALFTRVDWLRANGVFGGGARFVATDETVFNRASVNISQVQYEKDPSKNLASASAISTIIHPQNPYAPSMHMHISWTEMKSGNGYWRIMADLNPSLPSAIDTQTFDAAIRELMPEDLYRYGTEQGNRYFYIPALQRCRGVAHFYLEEFRSADAAADLQLARKFGQKVIDTYTDIVRRVLNRPLEIKAIDWLRQLEYHSLYFLQVLTLDRGTTSGLLVHDENDAGILASLPSHVDRKLLQSWLSKLPAVQQGLLKGILEVLPEGDKSLIDDQVKIKIAQFSRDFYRKNPDAEAFLARGDRVPPTQQNHS